MRILILGAYGLIGQTVADRLAAAGHEIVGMGRSVEAARLRRPNMTWIAADIAKLVKPESWQPHLARIDAVVNCAGALQDGARDNVRALQVTAMLALYAACKAHGPTRIIQISAAGASSAAPTEFMRTKAEADAALMASGLDWLILRPGLVISPVSYGATGLLRALASIPRITPLMSSSARIQCVHVDDVAYAVLAGIEHRAKHGCYDLVEDEAHSLAAVVAAFRAWLGEPPARTLVVPRWLGRIAFLAGDALGLLGWRPPVRTTALASLEAGITGDPKPWIGITGRHLTPLAEILRRVPAGAQERWFASMWLLKPVIVGTLALFWIVSGWVGLARLGAAAGLLAERGAHSGLATAVVAIAAVVDIALGFGALVQRTHKLALLGMIATTAAYLAGGTLLAPELWLDPLGVYVKTIPAAILALVALAIAEER